MASSDDTALAPEVLDELAGRVGSVLEGDRQGRGVRVGVACSRFNGAITWRLLGGALAGFEECGVDRADVKVAWAPGAFELPLVARRLAEAGAVDAVTCLGAVIRGETGHYEFVAGQCAAGLQRVQLDTGIPVAFGVLTTESLSQALERSQEDESNKGREAALTAIEMHRLLTSPSFLS